MTDPKSNLTSPPLLLCIDALAYNWVVSSNSTRVDLDPITSEPGSSLPPDLILPITAFAVARAIDVPPIEGILVNAILQRRHASHDFKLASITQPPGAVQGVNSQSYRVRGWDQLSCQEQFEVLLQLAKTHYAHERQAIQAAFELIHKRQAQPHELARLSRPAHLTGLRPDSWQAIRESILKARGNSTHRDDPLATDVE